MINDFSVFPSDATEGRVGSYWYHEDTQSFFDDVDHYKMIKAMCRLSCSICDKHGIEQGNDSIKRRNKFKNIEQLKGHLYHRHKMFMCSLCLEGRKIFICEQKLYTRAQLNQHIKTGDSEVDGSESDRGGFMGHPMCEFCRNPFYGDNELYLHMSTEHYTCHICQRQHPGQYDYYKNYDDLEIHFRQEHFLCENESCLAKKFIVFQSEAEMKRHNAIEHGGHMSRSKRNAVLQIPTSFRYRRINEQERRRGRGRVSHLESSDDQLSMAIQASLETSNADNSTRDSSSSAQQITDNGETSELDAVMGPFEALTIAPDTEPTSRYLQAASQNSRSTRLEESLFPPLSGASSGSRQFSSLDSEGPGENTMAARLRPRRKGTVTVLNSAQSRTWSNHGLGSSSSSPTVPTAFPALVSSSSKNSTHSRAAVNHGPASSSLSYSSLTRQATDRGRLTTSAASSSKNASSSSRVIHSVSAPNLVDIGSSNSSMPNAVLASGIRNQMPSTSGRHSMNADVQTANKSLVEQIRSGLGQDEDKYAAFKNISSEYRQGLVDTGEYLAYVEQFGLSHLVPDLARLCPDAEKQRELIDTYNAWFQKNGSQENGVVNCVNLKERKGSKKSKGKQVDVASNDVKDTLADSVINTVRKLQANYKPSEEVEILSKDGYRADMGKSKIPLVAEQAELSSANRLLANSSGNDKSLSNDGGFNQNSGGGGNNKQRRKTSKFHRVRLGDGSTAALLDLRGVDTSPEPKEETEAKNNPTDGLPVHGVWRNGGGQRLVARTQWDSAK